jgi:hypothetical protein
MLSGTLHIDSGGPDYTGVLVAVITDNGQRVYPDAIINSARLGIKEHEWITQSNCGDFYWFCRRCGDITDKRSFEADLPDNLKNIPWNSPDALQKNRAKQELYLPWLQYAEETTPKPVGPCICRGPIDLVLEIKPIILSFGETLRQLNTYLERLGSNWQAWVVTPDCRFDKQFEQNKVRILHPLPKAAIFNSLHDSEAYSFANDDCMLLDDDALAEKLFDQADELSKLIQQPKKQINLLE